MLESIPKAEKAHYKSDAHYSKSRLQEGTREQIFKILKKWEEEHAKGMQAQPVCVLVGEAGTGKSTIAWEFSKRLQARGRLGASFFFARGVQDLNSPRMFFSTIASQLAISQNALRTPVINAAREHLKVTTTQQLEDEFNDLILKPLSALPISHPPVFVVVDALDECTEQGPVLVPTLLRLLLSCAMCARSPLRVFLTSRPEPHYIHGVLHAPDLNAHISGISIQKFRDSVDKDMEALIRARLLQDPHGPSGRWLEENPSIVSTLVQHSDGLFIYARTAVDFILSDLSDLQHRYELLMTTFTSLDGLYRTVLESVLSPDERYYPSMQNRFKRVLEYLVALQEPHGISPKTLEALTGMKSADSIPILNKLRSVVFFEHDNVDACFRIVHATFQEFLVDQLRSGEAFHVNSEHAHGLLADSCMEVCKTFVDAHWKGFTGLHLLLELLSKPLPETSDAPHLQYAARYFCYHHERQSLVLSQETKDTQVPSDHGSLPETSIARFVVLREPGNMWKMMATILQSFRHSLPAQERMIDTLSIPCISVGNITVGAIPMFNGCE